MMCAIEYKQIKLKHFIWLYLGMCMCMCGGTTKCAEAYIDSSNTLMDIFYIVIICVNKLILLYYF